MMHALAFICSINGAQIETYVDEYYSVGKVQGNICKEYPFHDRQVTVDKCGFGIQGAPTFVEAGGW